MMRRVAIWYWTWFVDALARDFEKGLSDDKVPFMTAKEFAELMALILCFPIGAIGLVWETEVRNRDLRSRLRKAEVEQ